MPTVAPLFLALQVLLSAVGLPLQQHFCRGERQSLEILGTAHACCRHDAPTSSAVREDSCHGGHDHGAHTGDSGVEPSVRTPLATLVPSAEGGTCCADESLWRVDNADARTEHASAIGVTASAMPVANEFRPYAWSIVVAQAEGSLTRRIPRARDAVAPPRDQARALIQVYQV